MRRDTDRWKDFMYMSKTDDDLLSALQNFLRSAAVDPSAKVLLMLLADEGKATTAETLAEYSGLTPKSVHFHLRALVASGVVVTQSSPDYAKELFVKTYALPPKPEYSGE